MINGRVKSNKTEFHKLKRLMEAGRAVVSWVERQVPGRYGSAFVDSVQVAIVSVQFLAPANDYQVYFMKNVPTLRSASQPLAVSLLSYVTLEHG
jgi:hypothetical protein